VNHRPVKPLLLAAAIAALPASAHAIDLYESDDGEISFGIGGYTQPYFRVVQNPCNWSSAAEPACSRVVVPDGFGLSRARLVFEGDYAERGSFKLELRTIPNVELLEMQVSFEPLEWLRIDVGRYKVQFSRQDLTSESRLQFDRSDFSRAMPGRQLGMSATATFGPSAVDDLIMVSAGLFNGESDSDRAPVNNIDEAFLVAGRLEVAPFGRPRYAEGDLRSAEDRRTPSLVVGAGAAYSERSPENDNFRQQSMGADVMFMVHGISVYAEGFRYDRDYRDDLLNADKFGQGAVAQVGVFVPAPYLREHLEVAGRVQAWDPDVARDPDRDEELVAQSAGSGAANPSGTQGRVAYSGGLNWYFFGHDLKLQLNYTRRVETEDYARSATSEPGVVGSVTKQIDDDSFLAQLTMRF